MEKDILILTAAIYSPGKEKNLEKLEGDIFLSGIVATSPIATWI